MGKNVKQHDKKRYETGVYGPDGVFYNTGQRGQVELRMVLVNGKNKGRMMWCHKTNGMSWDKKPNDEIRREQV